MAELTLNSQVRLKNGKTCRVKKELGRGGEGIVYLVDYQGKDYALKWYLKERPDAFYDNLLHNINKGAPAPNFIWPLAVTEHQKGYFGYLMELRPSGYYDMSSFLLLQARFKSVQAQLNACLQICQAFQKLHINGLSYQDMNDGNFFINPDTGDVLICDNDNVAPDGTVTGILGKVGYMAPEIVEGKSMPNKYTDYFSLAVCLFILIYMNRPFEGLRYLSCPCDSDANAAKKLFGYDAVFIMDPDNPVNRPVKGVHTNVIRRWGVYPQMLSSNFCKTFSKEALMNPSKRVTDKEWHYILLQVRSMFVKCPFCKRDIFLQIAEDRTCVYCKKTITSVQTLKVGRFFVPLTEGQKVYACMTNNSSNDDAVAGEVVDKNGNLGIVNRSEQTWTGIRQDGQMKVAANGQGLPAMKGLTIKFGQGETGQIF